MAVVVEDTFAAPTSTPSKKVCFSYCVAFTRVAFFSVMLMIYNEQVAAAIEAMELKTPTKVSKKSLDPFIIDDKELSHSPKSVTDEEDMVELRKRFVGDIDLP